MYSKSSMQKNLILISPFFLILGCYHYRGLGPYITTGAPVDEKLEKVITPLEVTPAIPLFQWPVSSVRFSRGFFDLPGRRHDGVDLIGPRGEPILASFGGVVIYSGNSFSGYGNLVIIEHPNEWATFYAHLDEILVEKNQMVSRGQKVGRMGMTGRATGVHLHFEVRHQKRPIDPKEVLPKPNEPDIFLGYENMRPDSKKASSL